MYSHPTPIAYPTTPEEERKWGFDILKPKGTPYAWVHDWKGAKGGFGVPEERIAEVMSWKVPDDLGLLTADELAAARTRLLAGMNWHAITTVESVFGDDGLDKFMRRYAFEAGKVGWTKTVDRVGSPPSLAMAAWYQDIAHLVYGPPTNGYAWFDDEKQVLTRQGWGMLVPQDDQLKYTKLYRKLCDYWIEAYMSVTPELLNMTLMDIQDDPEHKRMVNLWTYEKSVVEGLPDQLKSWIPAHHKAVLREKGVRL